MNTVESFISSYESALASQDWDQVAPLIHPDCVAVFNDGTYSGKEAVAAAFKRTFALIQDETYQISDVNWLRKEPDYAVMVFRFSWSGLIDGKPASGSGRGTSVLVFDKAGWQLLCEHLGPLPRQ